MKIPVLGSLFNRVASLQLVYKEAPVQLLWYEFHDTFKNTFFMEHLGAIGSEYAPSFRIFSTRKMSAAVASS